MTCALGTGGIKDLQNDFGCIDDPMVVGLERRRTRRAPDHLTWQTDGRKNGLRGLYCPRRPWRNDAPTLRTSTTSRSGNCARRGMGSPSRRSATTRRRSTRCSLSTRRCRNWTELCGSKGETSSRTLCCALASPPASLRRW